MMKSKEIMSKKRRILIFFILSIFVFISSSALLFLIFKKSTLAAECDYCCPPPCPGGLVPCGRSCDDPTTAIIESAPCTLCHLFVLGKRIIDFLAKDILFPLAVLMLVAGGIMFLTAGGSPEKISSAKKLVLNVAIGILIILTAWIIVNTFIYFLTKGSAGGVATILGNPWNKIPCPVPTGIFPCCGDAIVQQPEGGPFPYTFNEECEKNEPLANFLARGKDDLDKDGDVDMADYTIMQNSCTDECILACKDDPLFTQIGEGCYLPGVECQKGKYVCDIPTNKVVCKDVYPTPVYDYCCRAKEDPSYSLNDAQADLAAISWTRVKPYAASHGTRAAEAAGYPETYKCDEVCRNEGKICIGTAITNDMTTYCYGVRCHSGNDCTLDANMARIDCRLEYPFTRKDASSANKCTNPETYYVGYTSCLCK